MAWNFRYYEKKRGHRRTGSRTVGSIGEAVFFAVLFLAGCAGFLALVFWLVIPEWRANHGFIAHTCTVLQKKLGEKEGENGALYRPEIKIEYQVHGITYRPVTYDIHHDYTGDREAAQAALNRFVERQKYPCWYDPADPGVAVLVRGYQWWIWLVFFIPLSFVAIGAGGLVYAVLHWGQSAEGRAAMARLAQPLELLDPATRPKFPFVPDDRDISSSPGTHLAYRLPLSQSPAWMLFGMFVACLLWNGIVSFFVCDAVQGWMRRSPDWFLSVFIIPFVIVGVVLVVAFVRQLLVTTGIGTTWVEISAHPLAPGGRCRLFVSQAGRLRMNSFEVFLCCEEEATYRQGTNTRTESRQVLRKSILRREGFAIEHSQPFEAQCDLAVPGGAMHSFKAAHNAIQWKVIVQGDVANWPDFERSFNLIVQPGPQTSARSTTP